MDCRKVHCRTGQIRNAGGKCQYVTMYWATQYELTVDLTPNQKIPVEYIDAAMNGSVMSWLRSPFPRDWNVVMLLYQFKSVPTNSMVEKLVVSLRFETTLSLQKLFTVVKTLMKNTWYAELNGTAFRLRQEFSPVYDFHQSAINADCAVPAFSKDFEKVCRFKNLHMPLNILNHQVFVMTKLIFCDQVELRDSEYDVIAMTKVIFYKRKQKVLFEGEFVSVYNWKTGNHTVRLCLADAGFKLINGVVSIFCNRANVFYIVVLYNMFLNKFVF